MKIIIPILIISMTGACNNMFNKDDNNGPELNIQSSQAPDQTTTFNGDTLVFQGIQKGEEPQEYPPFTSKVKDNQIVINGYYLASSGFQPSGTFQQEESRITINVKKAEYDDEAPSISVGFFYDAYISNLSKGEYTVQLIHQNDLMRGTEGEEHTVFTKEFVIK